MFPEPQDPRDLRPHTKALASIEQTLSQIDRHSVTDRSFHSLVFFFTSPYKLALVAASSDVALHLA